MDGKGAAAVSKWLIIAGKQISQHIDQQLTATGVRVSQYYYILKIHDTPHLTQKDLINAEFVNPSNVTRALKQLEAAGLLTRTRSRTDKRALELELTDAGQAAYPIIRRVIDREEAIIRRAVTAAFPDFDDERLAGVLKLIANLHVDAGK